MFPMSKEVQLHDNMIGTCDYCKVTGKLTVTDHGAFICKECDVCDEDRRFLCDEE